MLWVYLGKENRESARILANRVPFTRTLTSLWLVRSIACLSAMLKARACSRHSPTSGGTLDSRFRRSRNRRVKKRKQKEISFCLCEIGLGISPGFYLLAGCIVGEACDGHVVSFQSPISPRRARGAVSDSSHEQVARRQPQDRSKPKAGDGSKRRATLEGVRRFHRLSPQEWRSYARFA